MAAVGLEVHAAAVAVGQVFGAGDLTFPLGTNFAHTTSGSTVAAVGAVSVGVDTNIAAGFLAGGTLQLTLAGDTSFTGFAGGAAVAAVGVIGLGVDAFVGAVAQARLARQLAGSAFADLTGLASFPAFAAVGVVGLGVDAFLAAGLLSCGTLKLTDAFLALRELWTLGAALPAVVVVGDNVDTSTITVVWVFHSGTDAGGFLSVRQTSSDTWTTNNIATAPYRGCSYP